MTNSRYIGSVALVSTFAERLDELLAAAGGPSALSRAAGLSDGYCSTLKSRLRTNANARPDDEALEALARAGGVSYEWLRKGTEPRQRGPETEPQRVSSTSNEPFADALAAVFDGRRHTLADLDAARRVARETYTHLREGADTEAIAATWLNAASALRREGREVTPTAILVHLTERVAGEREQRASDEADAALRARGLEPGEATESVSALKKRLAGQKQCQPYDCIDNVSRAL